jgi:cytochrome c peroxidase
LRGNDEGLAEAFGSSDSAGFAEKCEKAPKRVIAAAPVMRILRHSIRAIKSGLRLTAQNSIWRPSMRRIKPRLLPALLLLAAFAAVASGLSVLGRSVRPTGLIEASERAELDGLEGEPITPLPRTTELDPRKVKLGRRLFQDARLSVDNSVSCASCHHVGENGADTNARSAGVGGALGDINTPTVFNSGFSFRQFWNGRADTLEDQIEGPIHNPAEMATDWPQILEKLQADSEYVAAFSSIYATKIESRTIKDAIATFERSLITPDCRFDRYLRGDGNALTAEEKEGYRLFKDSGCSSCHQGVLVGGNMFEKFGIVRDYFADRGRITKADLGRFNVTGVETDRFEFKVPSLRNVARTAPYFHDGSAQSLEEAVGVMARYQLGRELTATELQRIVQFLETLTGRTPEGEP